MKKTINISLILLAFLALFLIIWAGYKNKNLVKAIPLETATENQTNQTLNTNAPQHINLTDFYFSYGTRLLGNDQIKIISREEWEPDLNYADPDYIASYCLEKYCDPENYDTEDNYITTDKLAVKTLNYNYRHALESWDLSTIQTKIKENKASYEYLPVEEFIIHHTAGRTTYSYEDSINEIKRIYFNHALTHRWQDIGYHYLIDAQGRIFEGSLGGKYSVGIHTYMHNRGNVSIALMGDLRPDYSQMSTEMKTSLAKLISYLAKEYDLDLYASQYYLKKKDLSGREWLPSIIRGHKELDIRLSPTFCPGVDSDTLRTDIYTELKNLTENPL